jgi:hypothetical protein
MWLFLIFLDLIATCIFGFFIYKSFFIPTPARKEPFLDQVLVQDIKPTQQDTVLTPKAEDKVTAPASPEVETAATEEVKITDEPAPQEAAQPVKEATAVKQDDSQKAEAKKADAKDADKKADKKAADKKNADKKADKKSDKNDSDKVSSPKKQSVFISGSGKTKRITFKYYGTGRKVSVAGGFTSHPVAMKKSGKEWSASVNLFPGSYKYIFIVDGVKTSDPNAKGADGKSVFTVK